MKREEMAGSALTASVPRRELGERTLQCGRVSAGLGGIAWPAQLSLAPAEQQGVQGSGLRAPRAQAAAAANSRRRRGTQWLVTPKTQARVPA